MWIGTLADESAHHSQQPHHDYKSNVGKVSWMGDWWISHDISLQFTSFITGLSGNIVPSYFKTPTARFGAGSATGFLPACSTSQFCWVQFLKRFSFKQRYLAIRKSPEIRVSQHCPLQVLQLLWPWPGQGGSWSTTWTNKKRRLVKVARPPARCICAAASLAQQLGDHLRLKHSNHVNIKLSCRYKADDCNGSSFGSSAAA